jgi:hypothetical protein
MRAKYLTLPERRLNSEDDPPVKLVMDLTEVSSQKQAGAPPSGLAFSRE